MPRRKDSLTRFAQRGRAPKEEVRIRFTEEEICEVGRTGVVPPELEARIRSHIERAVRTVKRGEPEQ